MNNTKTAKTFGVAVCYTVFFAIAFWLLFYHLDNHLLWGDEAETAVLAKNVVRFGVPQTFDGTNNILLHGTVDENLNHVWTWSPWMQNYLAAGSFILFGPATWAARAPFALIGWLAVVLLGTIAWKIYKSHRVALAAMLLLGTSEIFLLHARQCRYYSISVFGEILLIYGIHELLASRRRGGWLVALAFILEFYSNYIIAAANLPALICLAWMLRKQGKAAVFRLAVVFGVLFASILPWLLYAHPLGQVNYIGKENFFLKALGYIIAFHFQFIPLCFFLLPLAGFFLNSGKQPVVENVTQQWEHLLLLLIVFYFLAVLFPPGFSPRYQLPLLPVMCLLTAVWVFRYVKWRALAASIIIVQLSSNFFSIVSAFPFRQGRALRFPLVEFVRGMDVPYTNRFADVLDFFKKHAHPGETVLSFDPEFPLIFYTQLAVIDGRIMPPPPGRFPDWVLPYSASGVILRKPITLSEFLKTRYTLITISVHDSPLFDCLPEPGYYQYHTTQTRVPFLIYKLNFHSNEPVSPP